MITILAMAATLWAQPWKLAAQCGPDQSRPYPPGSSVCPTFADQMPGHGPPPPGGGPGGGPPGGGPPGGGGTEGGGASASCTVGTVACPAPLLNDVGLTTASGQDDRSGVSFSPGENIYGPFEAGFTSQQDFILADLGCATGRGYVAGGIDTHTAEQMVAQDCGVTLPRVESGQYISLLDECGGHTREYHFHERLSCLYTTITGSGHSTKVGEGNDGKSLYGKWEDYSTMTLPELDACGGHFGVTPDSNGQVVYHYHVQDNPPFTIGCYGPIEETTGVYKLVTMAECRAAYPDDCGDGDQTNVNVPSGTKAYDLWCPCYDESGNNVNPSERSVFSSGSTTTCSGAACIPASTRATGGDDMTDDMTNSATHCAAGMLTIVLAVSLSISTAGGL